MRWMERATAQIIDNGLKPVTVRAPPAPPRNVLRHITQSHVAGVTVAAQYLPTDTQRQLKYFLINFSSTFDLNEI